MHIQGSLLLLSAVIFLFRSVIPNGLLLSAFLLLESTVLPYVLGSVISYLVSLVGKLSLTVDYISLLERVILNLKIILHTPLFTLSLKIGKIRFKINLREYLLHIQGSSPFDLLIKDVLINIKMNSQANKCPIVSKKKVKESAPKEKKAATSEEAMSKKIDIIKAVINLLQMIRFQLRSFKVTIGDEDKKDIFTITFNTFLLENLYTRKITENSLYTTCSMDVFQFYTDNKTKPILCWKDFKFEMLCHIDRVIHIREVSLLLCKSLSISLQQEFTTLVGTFLSKHFILPTTTTLPAKTTPPLLTKNASEEQVSTSSIDLWSLLYDTNYINNENSYLLTHKNTLMHSLHTMIDVVPQSIKFSMQNVKIELIHPLQNSYRITNINTGLDLTLLISHEEINFLLSIPKIFINKSCDIEKMKVSLKLLLSPSTIHQMNCCLRSERLVFSIFPSAFMILDTLFKPVIDALQKMKASRQQLHQAEHEIETIEPLPQQDAGTQIIDEFEKKVNNQTPANDKSPTEIIPQEVPPSSPRPSRLPLRVDLKKRMATSLAKLKTHIVVRQHSSSPTEDLAVPPMQLEELTIPLSDSSSDSEMELPPLPGSLPPLDYHSSTEDLPPPSSMDLPKPNKVKAARRFIAILATRTRSIRSRVFRSKQSTEQQNVTLENKDSTTSQHRVRLNSFSSTTSTSESDSDVLPLTPNDLEDSLRSSQGTVTLTPKKSCYSLESLLFTFLREVEFKFSVELPLFQINVYNRDKDLSSSHKFYLNQFTLTFDTVYQDSFSNNSTLTIQESMITDNSDTLNSKQVFSLSCNEIYFGCCEKQNSKKAFYIPILNINSFMFSFSYSNGIVFKYDLSVMKTHLSITTQIIKTLVDTLTIYKTIIKNNSIVHPKEKTETPSVSLQPTEKKPKLKEKLVLKSFSGHLYVSHSRIQLLYTKLLVNGKRSKSNTYFLVQRILLSTESTFYENIENAISHSFTEENYYINESNMMNTNPSLTSKSSLFEDSSYIQHRSTSSSTSLNSPSQLFARSSSNSNLQSSGSLNGSEIKSPVPSSLFGIQYSPTCYSLESRQPSLSTINSEPSPLNANSSPALLTTTPPLYSLSNEMNSFASRRRMSSSSMGNFAMESTSYLMPNNEMSAPFITEATYNPKQASNVDTSSKRATMSNYTKGSGFRTLNGLIFKMHFMIEEITLYTDNNINKHILDIPIVDVSFPSIYILLHQMKLNNELVLCGKEVSLIHPSYFEESNWKMHVYRMIFNDLDENEIGVNITNMNFNFSIGYIFKFSTLVDELLKPLKESGLFKKKDASNTPQRPQKEVEAPTSVKATTSIEDKSTDTGKGEEQAKKAFLLPGIFPSYPFYSLTIKLTNIDVSLLTKADSGLDLIITNTLINMTNSVMFPDAHIESLKALQINPSNDPYPFILISNLCLTKENSNELYACEEESQPEADSPVLPSSLLEEKIETIEEENEDSETENGKTSIASLPNPSSSLLLQSKRTTNNANSAIHALLHTEADDIHKHYNKCPACSCAFNPMDECNGFRNQCCIDCGHIPKNLNYLKLTVDNVVINHSSFLPIDSILLNVLLQIKGTLQALKSMSSIHEFIALEYKKSETINKDKTLYEEAYNHLSYSRHQKESKDVFNTVIQEDGRAVRDIWVDLVIHKLCFDSYGPISNNMEETKRLHTIDVTEADIVVNLNTLFHNRGHLLHFIEEVDYTPLPLDNGFDDVIGAHIHSSTIQSIDFIHLNHPEPYRSLKNTTITGTVVVADLFPVDQFNVFVPIDIYFSDFYKSIPWHTRLSGAPKKIYHNLIVTCDDLNFAYSYDDQYADKFQTYNMKSFGIPSAIATLPMNFIDNFRKTFHGPLLVYCNNALQYKYMLNTAFNPMNCIDIFVDCLKIYFSNSTHLVLESETIHGTATYVDNKVATTISLGSIAGLSLDIYLKFFNKHPLNHYVEILPEALQLLNDQYQKGNKREVVNYEKYKYFRSLYIDVDANIHYKNVGDNTCLYLSGELIHVLDNMCEYQENLDILPPKPKMDENRLFIRNIKLNCNLPNIHVFVYIQYAKRDSNHCIKLTVNDISTLLDMQRSLVLNKKEVANGILPITQDVTDQVCQQNIQAVWNDSKMKIVNGTINIQAAMIQLLKLRPIIDMDWHAQYENPFDDDENVTFLDLLYIQSFAAFTGLNHIIKYTYNAELGEIYQDKYLSSQSQRSLLQNPNRWVMILLGMKLFFSFEHRDFVLSMSDSFQTILSKIKTPNSKSHNIVQVPSYAFEFPSFLTSYEYKELKNEKQKEWKSPTMAMLRSSLVKSVRNAQLFSSYRNNGSVNAYEMNPSSYPSTTTTTPTAGLFRDRASKMSLTASLRNESVAGLNRPSLLASRYSRRGNLRSSLYLNDPQANTTLDEIDEEAETAPSLSPRNSSGMTVAMRRQTSRMKRTSEASVLPSSSLYSSLSNARFNLNSTMTMNAPPVTYATPELKMMKKNGFLESARHTMMSIRSFSINPSVYLNSQMTQSDSSMTSKIFARIYEMNLRSKKKERNVLICDEDNSEALKSEDKGKELPNDNMVVLVSNTQMNIMCVESQASLLFHIHDGSVKTSKLYKDEKCYNNVTCDLTNIELYLANYKGEDRILWLESTDSLDNLNPFTKLVTNLTIQVHYQSVPKLLNDQTSAGTPNMTTTQVVMNSSMGGSSVNVNDIMAINVDVPAFSASLSGEEFFQALTVLRYVFLSNPAYVNEKNLDKDVVQTETEDHRHRSINDENLEKDRDEAEEKDKDEAKEQAYYSTKKEEKESEENTEEFLTEENISAYEQEVRDKIRTHLISTPFMKLSYHLERFDWTLLNNSRQKIARATLDGLSGHHVYCKEGLGTNTIIIHDIEMVRCKPEEEETEETQAPSSDTSIPNYSQYILKGIPLDELNNKTVHYNMLEIVANVSGVVPIAKHHISIYEHIGINIFPNTRYYLLVNIDQQLATDLKTYFFPESEDFSEAEEMTSTTHLIHTSRNDSSTIDLPSKSTSSSFFTFGRRPDHKLTTNNKDGNTKGNVDLYSTGTEPYSDEVQTANPFSHFYQNIKVYFKNKKALTCEHKFALSPDPGYCDVCNKKIHYLRNPGYVCEKCNIHVHPECMEIAIYGKKSLKKNKNVLSSYNYIRHFHVGPVNLIFNASTSLISIKNFALILRSCVFMDRFSPMNSLVARLMKQYISNILRSSPTLFKMPFTTNQLTEEQLKQTFQYENDNEKLQHANDDSQEVKRDKDEKKIKLLLGL